MSFIKPVKAQDDSGRSAQNGIPGGGSEGQELP